MAFWAVKSGCLHVRASVISRWDCLHNHTKGSREAAFGDLIVRALIMFAHAYTGD